MRKTKTWSKDKVMPAATWLALQKRIHDNLEIFNHEEVSRAAEDFELTIAQVSTQPKNLNLSSHFLCGEIEDSCCCFENKCYRPSACMLGTY